LRPREAGSIVLNALTFPAPSEVDSNSDFLSEDLQAGSIVLLKAES